MTNQKKGENVRHSKINEVVLMHCNLINNDYQQDSRFFYMFVPNKSFGQLLHISPKGLVFLKTFLSEVSYIEETFTESLKTSHQLLIKV